MCALRCAAVGILAAHCCFVRGADRVVLIDKQQYRWDRAKSKMPHLETINFAGELGVAGHGSGELAGASCQQLLSRLQLWWVEKWWQWWLWCVSVWA